MRVTVIGSGYVGLVTGACLASVGHHTTCVDVLTDRIEMINRGEVPFYEPGLQTVIQDCFKKGNLHATSDLSQAMLRSKVSIIAVGTPFDGGGVDLSYVKTAAVELGRILRELDYYHVVAVKSTVPPGTTDTVVRQMIEENSGRRVGEFGLCMNPEFLREGSAVDDFMHPDRIVIGQSDERSGNVLAELYKDFDCAKLHTSLRNAELIKYTSNALLSVLISFSNEIASLCEATPGTDVETVMDVLHLDKRLSPLLNGQRIIPGILSYLRAGAGFGGSCLPKDLNTLRMFARMRKIPTPLLDATIQVNEERPRQVGRLVELALAGLGGRTLALLGLGFKPGTDDLRDSPALSILRYLLDRAAIVRAYDPLASSKAKSLIDSRVTVCGTPEEALTDVDGAVIATALPEFTGWNWHRLCGRMRRPVIIDGRNALRHVSLPAQVVYWPVGLSKRSDGETGHAR